MRSVRIIVRSVLSSMLAISLVVQPFGNPNSSFGTARASAAGTLAAVLPAPSTRVMNAARFGNSPKIAYGGTVRPSTLAELRQKAAPAQRVSGTRSYMPPMLSVPHDARRTSLDPLAIGHHSAASFGIRHLVALGVANAPSASGITASVNPSNARPGRVIRTKVNQTPEYIRQAALQAARPAVYCPANLYFKGPSMPRVSPLCACPPTYRKMPGQPPILIANSNCHAATIPNASMLSATSTMDFMKRQLFPVAPIIPQWHVAPQAVGPIQLPRSSLPSSYTARPGAQLGAKSAARKFAIGAAGMSASAYSSAVLVDAPLAYYRLNDAGAAAYDSGPNALNGVVGSALTEGNPSLMSDPGAASMAFPATSKSAIDEVRVAETPKLEPTTAFSADFWFQARAFTGDIFSYGNDNGWEPYSVGLDPSGKVCPWFTTTTSHQFVCSTATLTMGGSYYFAVTYDGANVRIYLNGALDSTWPVTGNIAAYDTTNGLALGGGYALSDGNYNGFLQDLAIYGTVLSPARIAAHYQAASPQTTYASTVLADSPFAFYRLNDQGTTAFDDGPNGLSGAIGSSVTTGMNSLNHDVAAMKFPGGTESAAIQVRVPQNAALQPTSAVSIEFWTTPSVFTGDIVSYGNDNGSEPYSFGIDASGHVGFWLHTTNDGGSSLVSNTALSTAQTYHIVGAYDGTSRCIYINGAVDACAPETGVLANYDTTNGLAVGGGYAFSDAAYGGTTAGVALYSRALTSGQVTAHYQAGTSQSSPTPTSTPTSTPTPLPTSSAAPTPTPLPTSTPSITSGNTFTGINPWWTYEEGAIPGVGKYMANVGTGQNLLVQADDMAIPNRGIELAFRRTYNSGHPAVDHNPNGDDGGPPGSYGTGWTNTFDARLAYNSGNANGVGLSVFDIDGARYDYVPDGAGHWIPPSGQHAQLTWDGGTGYYWTKKSGTTYYFFSPSLVNNPQYAGLAGRISVIFGRNQNNRLDFNYSFSNPASTSAATLTQLDVVTDNTGSTARHAIITFADFNGHRLAQALQWPNGQIVSYSYDNAGNLIEVDEPPNSASTASCHGVTSCLPETYGYYAGTSLLQYAVGPRWMISGATDGGYENFQYNSSNGIAEIDDYGNVNPAINDGYSSGPIQSNAPNTASNYIYRRVHFYNNGVTTFWRDTDGHGTDYTYDGSGRVTLRQEHTISNVLSTTQGWDAQNNLSYETDARGNQTDYANDANGNVIAVATAQDTTSAGTFRPTSLYSYDAFNNLTAACDPVNVNNSHLNWIGSPPTTSTPCARAVGATQYYYSYPSYEPYGELMQSVTPLGYHKAYAYDPNAQAGVDDGLPSSVTGDSFTQTDGTVLAMQDAFRYDSLGNMISYTKGTGTTTFAYDGLASTSLGRLQSTTDPDGFRSNVTYFANGSVSGNQTPFQSASGLGVTRTYDADGDVTSEMHHYGCTSATSCTAGVTQRWYDGADRLIEVSQPGNTYFNAPLWLTRYKYDLSMGGQQQFAGSPLFAAYGNLYATQELPDKYATWQDIAGTSYDGLDRPLSKYKFSPGDPSVNAYAQSFSYDSPSTLGLLSSSTNAVGETLSYSYNPSGKIATLGSSDNSVASLQYTYDPDGRKARLASSTYGAEVDTYDADGRETSVQEPSANTSYTSPVTITYAYYPNGNRATLSTLGGNFTQTPLLKYTYTSLDTLASETGNLNNTPQTFSFAYTSAGRIASETDPFTGSKVPGTASQFVPTVWSHDPSQYGRVSGVQYANASLFQSIAYDAEDNVAGWTIPVGSIASGPVTVAHGYNARGELLRENVRSASPSSSGLVVNNMAYNGGVGGKNIDARTGVDAFEAMSAPGCSVTPNDTVTNTFDKAGRETLRTLLTHPTDSGCTAFSQTETKTYDAMDHILSAGGYVNSQYNYAFGWGPNGHVATITSTSAPTSTTSVHWDGDHPLFESDANGKIIAVMIGDFADYSASLGSSLTLEVIDRDLSSKAIMYHNATGYDFWEPVGTPYVMNPKFQEAAYSPDQPPSPNFNHFGGVLYPLKRTDALDIASRVEISGVRAYDTGLGSWTTPDAYAGVLHDPLSQKLYAWNRNNSIAYSDPSGFDAIDLVFRNARPFLPGEYHSYIRITHDDKTVTQLSFGPSPSGLWDISGERSTLRLQSQHYEDGNADRHVQRIATCKGECTPTNGHFDENAMRVEASKIDGLRLRYDLRAGAFGPNSNSAASSLCVAGGASMATCVPALGLGVSAPGGSTILK